MEPSALPSLMAMTKGPEPGEGQSPGKMWVMGYVPTMLVDSQFHSPHVHTHVLVHTHTQAHIYMHHVCAETHMCTTMRAHTCMHPYMCRDIHVYTNAHTHTPGGA